MIQFKAQYFDGYSSKPFDVIVEVDSKGYISLRPEQHKENIPNIPEETTLKNLNISRRLGNTPRQLKYPEGQTLVVNNNTVVDEIIKRYGKENLLRKAVTLFESKLRYIPILFIIAVALVSFIKFIVLPAATTRIAHQMPQKVVTKIGEQSFSDIETILFSASTLSEETQTRIKKHFEPLMQQFNDIELTVEFRDSHIGPNALAFPHGMIVFTDDLVNLAQHDDELLAIFAHEIGHVYHRHSMQNIVHQSSLNLLITMAFGGAGTGLAGGISNTIMNGSYSRHLETEADDFSLHYAEHEVFDPVHFSNIMQRMVESSGIECSRENHKVSCGSDEENAIEGFLSTHPVSEDRIQRFLNLHLTQQSEKGSSL